jgi:hypothetical protein
VVRHRERERALSPQRASSMETSANKPWQPPTDRKRFGKGVSLLERLFPWTMDKLTKGMTVEAARRKRCCSTDRASRTDYGLAMEQTKT